MTQGRVDAIGEKFIVDEHGLMWDSARPEGVREGWNAPPPGRVLGDEEAAAEEPPAGIQSTVPRTALTATAGAPASPTISSTPEPLSPQRQVLSPAQVFKVIEQAKRLTGKHARAPSISGQPEDKRTRRSPSEDDVVITKVSTMLHNLRVTGMKAEAASRASGRLRSQTIRKYDVPVSEPTKLGLALWRMIVSRVKAFKDGLKKVDMAPDDERLIAEAEPKMYRDAAERLINGIAKANYDEPNLAIYCYCSLPLCQSLSGDNH